MEGAAWSPVPEFMRGTRPAALADASLWVLGVGPIPRDLRGLQAVRGWVQAAASAMGPSTSPWMTRLVTLSGVLARAEVSHTSPSWLPEDTAIGLPPRLVARLAASGRWPDERPAPCRLGDDLVGVDVGPLEIWGDRRRPGTCIRPPNVHHPRLERWGIVILRGDRPHGRVLWVVRDSRFVPHAMEGLHPAVRAAVARGPGHLVQAVLAGAASAMAVPKARADDVCSVLVGRYLGSVMAYAECFPADQFVVAESQRSEAWWAPDFFLLGPAHAVAAVVSDVVERDLEVGGCEVTRSFVSRVADGLGDHPLGRQLGKGVHEDAAAICSAIWDHASQQESGPGTRLQASEPDVFTPDTGKLGHIASSRASTLNSGLRAAGAPDVDGVILSNWLAPDVATAEAGVPA
mgnify:CR=1 FL=1